MIYPFRVDTSIPSNSVILKAGDVVWYVHNPNCVTDCQSKAVVIKVYERQAEPDRTWIRIKFPRRDWGMNGEYDTFSNKCYPMRTPRGNTYTGDL